MTLIDFSCFITGINRNEKRDKKSENDFENPLTV